MIWQQVFAAEQVRATWQQWRDRVSLAVQLLILALVVVAMADPQVPAPRRIVLILDNSASMNVADAQPTRLARAKEAAGRLIAGLGSHDQAAILSAGEAVAVRCGRTNDRATLLEVLEAVPMITWKADTRVRSSVSKSHPMR